MKNKKLIIIIGVVVILIIGVFSFYFISKGHEKLGKSASAITSEPTVRLAVANEILDALILIARDKGFFEEEGIDVTVSEYASGKLALQAMFTGDVQVVPVAEVPIVFNSFKWDDFSVIATIGVADKHMSIVARKDLGIERPSDLRGKRIATQKASALHYFSSIFLKQNGLSEQDVQRSFLHITKLVKALVDGKVDAIVVIEPFTTEAKERLGTNAVSFTPSGIYEKTWSLLAFNDYIDSNPEVILKLVRALMRAEEFLVTDREESAKIIAKGLGKDTSWVLDNLDRLHLEVSMDQSYKTLLNDVAKWAINNNLTEVKIIPNYSDYLYIKAFEIASTNTKNNKRGLYDKN